VPGRLRVREITGAMSWSVAALDGTPPITDRGRTSAPSHVRDEVLAHENTRR
jgi:hypothetical protein